MDWNATIIGLAAGGGGAGAIAALFKVRAEKKKIGAEAGQISVSAAQGAVIVTTGVINTLRKEIGRLSEQMGELEMEAAARQKELEGCEHTINRLRLTVEYLQRDLDRHGRMTELARRRSHLLANAFSSLELSLEGLMQEMRKNNLPIPPQYDGSRLRADVRRQLDELAELERTVTYSAVASEAPEKSEGV